MYFLRSRFSFKISSIHAAFGYKLWRVNCGEIKRSQNSFREKEVLVQKPEVPFLISKETPLSVQASACCLAGLGFTGSINAGTHTHLIMKFLLWGALGRPEVPGGSSLRKPCGLTLSMLVPYFFSSSEVLSLWSSCIPREKITVSTAANC